MVTAKWRKWRIMERGKRKEERKGSKREREACLVINREKTVILRAREGGRGGKELREVQTRQPSLQRIAVCVCVCNGFWFWQEEGCCLYYSFFYQENPNVDDVGSVLFCPTVLDHNMTKMFKGLQTTQHPLTYQPKFTSNFFFYTGYQYCFFLRA